MKKLSHKEVKWFVQITQEFQNRIQTGAIYIQRLHPLPPFCSVSEGGGHAWGWLAVEGTTKQEQGGGDNEYQSKTELKFISQSWQGLVHTLMMVTTASWKNCKGPWNLNIKLQYAPLGLSKISPPTSHRYWAWTDDLYQSCVSLRHLGSFLSFVIVIQSSSLSLFLEILPFPLSLGLWHCTWILE